MITATRHVDPLELERQTGWAIKPEGACKEDRCVPLSWPTPPGTPLDLCRFAERLGMPLVHDSAAGLWCLGPESGGRALSSAVAPAFSLPDLDGVPFELATLRGKKVLLVAWASW
jgi:hypothetical protein